MHSNVLFHIPGWVGWNTISYTIFYFNILKGEL